MLKSEIFSEVKFYEAFMSLHKAMTVVLSVQKLPPEISRLVKLPDFALLSKLAYNASNPSLKIAHYFIESCRRVLYVPKY